MLSSNDVEQWFEAMDEELDLIKKNDVWELINLTSKIK